MHDGEGPFSSLLLFVTIIIVDIILNIKTGFTRLYVYVVDFIFPPSLPLNRV